MYSYSCLTKNYHLITSKTGYFTQHTVWNVIASKQLIEYDSNLVD